jgi:hypothetical protein
MKIVAIVLTLLLPGCALLLETPYHFTGALKLEHQAEITLAQKHFSAGPLDITLRKSNVSHALNGLTMAQHGNAIELRPAQRAPLVFGSFVLDQQLLTSPYRIEGNVQRQLIAQPRLVTDTEACSFAGFCDLEETIEETVCAGSSASPHDHSKLHSHQSENCETKKTTVTKNTWVHNCPGEKPIEITLQPARYQLTLAIYSADGEDLLLGSYQGQTQVKDEQISQRDTGDCEAIN